MYTFLLLWPHSLSMSDNTSATAIHTAIQVRYANLHLFPLTFPSFSSDLGIKMVINPLLISKPSHFFIQAIRRARDLKVHLIY